MVSDAQFKIVLLYKGGMAGDWARGVANRMAIEVRPLLEVRTEVWEIGLAIHPELCDRAARDATEADMIIVAAICEADLPLGFEAWMETWLPKKRGGMAALVALIGVCEDETGGTPRICDKLGRLAKIGGMDYFWKAGYAPRSHIVRYGLGSILSPKAGSISQGGRRLPEDDHVGGTENHMEVARLARRLWQQAGSPPGRFRDFWLKVAEANAASAAAKVEASTRGGLASVPH